MDYVKLYEMESYGGYGGFGIKILVAADNLPDLQQLEIGRASDSATRLITNAVRGAIKANDPKTPLATKHNRKIIDEVFTSPIFIEEIENGYCKDWCCAHLPWFIVTTTAGRFVIGWRKRVISIDWSETIGTETAEAIFANEEVTKGDKSIHAWSVEDAKRYVNTILSTAINQ